MTTTDAQTTYQPPLQVMGRKVLLVPTELPSTTAHGLALPDSARRRSNEATVAGLGPLVNTPEDRGLRVGQRVLLLRWAAYEVTVGAQKFLVAEEGDVLAALAEHTDSQDTTVQGQDMTADGRIAGPHTDPLEVAGA